jgi:hypothetical protein
MQREGEFDQRKQLMKDCPKCGKPMVENPKWRGHWMCPDYTTPINEAPPFQYRCTGQYFTQAAVDDFWRESLRLTAQRN